MNVEFDSSSFSFIFAYFAHLFLYVFPVYFFRKIVVFSWIKLYERFARVKKKPGSTQNTRNQHDCYNGSEIMKYMYLDQHITYPTLPNKRAPVAQWLAHSTKFCP